MFVLRLVVSRVLLSLLTLLLVSIIIFRCSRCCRATSHRASSAARRRPRALATLRAQLHLDGPRTRNAISTGSVASLRGDFGKALTSSRPDHRDPGAADLQHALPLGAPPSSLYLPLALIPAMIQAIRRDRSVDHVLSAITLVLLSTPDFLLGTLLLILFVIECPALSGDLAWSTRARRRRRISCARWSCRR